MPRQQQLIYPDTPTLVKGTTENPIRVSVGNDTLRYGTTRGNLSSSLSAGQAVTLDDAYYIKTDSDGVVVLETYDPWELEGGLVVTGLATEEYANDAATSAREAAEAYVDEPAETNAQSDTSYTPVTGDEGNKIVELTNAALVTVTLPATGFAENAQIEFCALGAAGATFVAGAGASLASPSSLVDLPQNCTAVARFRGGGAWLLTGALA